MVEVTEHNFDEVLKRGSFVLMFYTDWCPKCPPMIKALTELEDEADGKFTFAKINFDKNPGPCGFFGIFGVPATMIIKDFAVKKINMGAEGKDVLRERLALLDVTD